MPEINYKNLNSYLTKTQDKEAEFAPIYLIYGEELLFKTALHMILNRLVPGAKKSLNYEPIDGTNGNILEAIDKVNTFSLFSGTKVVALCDCQVFQSKQDKNKIAEKAKQAFNDNNMKKASNYILSILSLLKLSFEDITGANLNKVLELNNNQDDKWIGDIIDYCIDNNLKIPGKGDSESTALEHAIEKGFPKNNYLIITTEIVDKRTSLYKYIKTNGMIIDASVPKGNRKADKVTQESVLNERMNTILKQNNKTMNRDAYPVMLEMTGFDLRTFVNNLEKLVSFIGDRKNISINDVKSVLKRTKIDPIYEFTNAITDRSMEKSLFYMESLLSGPEIGHPLQLLAAITNQIRKLLNIKGFIQSSYSKAWYSGCSYQFFQANVISDIQAYDQDLLNELKYWEDSISSNTDNPNESVKKSKKKKSQITTDLVVAKNPKNPYPIYQIFKKSEQFTINELIFFLQELSKADFQLKSAGYTHKIVLERLIFSICKVVVPTEQ